MNPATSAQIQKRHPDRKSAPCRRRNGDTRSGSGQRFPLPFFAPNVFHLRRKYEPLTDPAQLSPSAFRRRNPVPELRSRGFTTAGAMNPLSPEMRKYPAYLSLS